LETGPADPIHGQSWDGRRHTNLKANMSAKIDRIRAGLLRMAKDNVVDLLGRTPALSIAARPAMTPSSVAVRSLSAPQYLPKGVRAAERITISFSNPVIYSS